MTDHRSNITVRGSHVEQLRQLVEDEPSSTMREHLGKALDLYLSVRTFDYGAATAILDGQMHCVPNVPGALDWSRQLSHYDGVVVDMSVVLAAARTRYPHMLARYTLRQAVTVSGIAVLVAWQFHGVTDVITVATAQAITAAASVVPDRLATLTLSNAHSHQVMRMLDEHPADVTVPIANAVIASATTGWPIVTLDNAAIYDRLHRPNLVIPDDKEHDHY